MILSHYNHLWLIRTICGMLLDHLTLKTSSNGISCGPLRGIVVDNYSIAPND